MFSKLEFFVDVQYESIWSSYVVEYNQGVFRVTASRVWNSRSGEGIHVFAARPVAQEAQEAGHHPVHRRLRAR